MNRRIKAISRSEQHGGYQRADERGAARAVPGLEAHADPAGVPTPGGASPLGREGGSVGVLWYGC